MIKSLQPMPTRRPVAPEWAGSTLDIDRTRAGATDVDACAYLFRACRDLQSTYRRYGLDCLFDVEPAQLPVTVCRAIALMMRAVIDDVLERAPSRLLAGTVALSLRRRGTAYAAVIVDRGLRDYGGQSDPDLASVRLLASEVGGECRIRAATDCRTVIVIVEPGSSAAPRSTPFRSNIDTARRSPVDLAL